MALRGGGAVWASMNDHAYLYANTLDKSIMYDLAVQRLAISGGGSTEALFWLLSHPTRPMLAAALPHGHQILRFPSLRFLCSDQGTYHCEGLQPYLTLCSN